jgi:TonB-dependent receptor
MINLTSNKIIVLLLFIFFPIVLYASGNIKGTVVDSLNNEPLGGANVFLQGSAFGAATDIQGHYEIKNIPAGTYTIKCSYIGYKAKEIQVIVPDNRTVEVNFGLLLDVLEGQTVVITAQAEGQVSAINKQLRSNTIINVVSQDRILEIPDANAAESVGRLPGVSILREGGEGTKVTIRGLAPTYNSVTVGGDKLPSTDFDDRSVDMSMISSEILAGIEVTKALTSDMEADALGGSIEFKLSEAPKGGFKYNLRYQRGYNHQRDDYGQYKGSLTISDRFFDDIFGIIITGNAESVQRGSDQFRADYNMLREKHDDEEYAPLSASSVRYRYIGDVRKRLGFTVLLDWQIPNGKILFNNFFSRLDRSEQTQERRFSLSGNYQYHNWLDEDTQIDIMTNSISGEHDASLFMVDWRLSRSQSYSRLPYSNTVHIREMSAFDYSKLQMEFKTPDDIVGAARNNIAETYLYEIWLDTEKSLERDLAGQLNITLPFTLTNSIAGKVKTGLKYKDKIKERDRNSKSSRLDEQAYGVRISHHLERHHTKYGTPGFEYLYTTQDYAQIQNYLDPNFNAEGFLNGSTDFGVGVIGEELNHALSAYILDSLMSTSAVRDIDDYELSEMVSSGYLMAEINFGQFIMLLPGVRFEGTNVEMTSRKGNIPDEYSELPLDSPPQITDTTATTSFNNWFPMLHLRIKPTDWFDIRLAYTNTISRPRLDYLLPKERLNGSARRITLGNPQMQPQLSTNYDIYASLYGNQVGLFSAGFFYKNIENLIYLREGHLLLDPVSEGYDPNWKGYYLDKPENSPFKTNVYGVEVEWQANLVWLPSPFDGLVLNLNYTHVWSETKYPRSIVRSTRLPVYPYIKTEVIDTFRVGNMINQANDIANLSVGYDYGPFSTRVSMLFQGKTLDEVGEREELDSYTNDYLRGEILMKYNITDIISVYLNLNNFLDTPDRSYTLSEIYETGEEYYDWTAYLGLNVRLK